MAEPTDDAVRDAFLDTAARARKAQDVVNAMGFGPETTPETTPSAEYHGDEQVTVTLTKNQAALIVFTLMEQSKQAPMREQIEWTRLALGLNDMIMSPQEADEDGTEPD